LQFLRRQQSSTREFKAHSGSNAMGMLLARARYNERMPGGFQGDDVRPASSGPTEGVKLTYDDFLLFPDDGNRHELIDGEHYVTPSPNTKHQQILVELLWTVRAYLEAYPIGRIFCAPLDIVLSRHDVVEPDLFYISHERAAKVLTPQHARGAPELVIEIASKSTRKRDETIKRRLYERDGVSEYWVVDPELDSIRVYRRAGDRFDRAVELTSERSDVLTTPLLPGLEVVLTRVFAEPTGASSR
jgi:Uma2 family endonuclease